MGNVYWLQARFIIHQGVWVPRIKRNFATN
jgi:hypothetical protein